MCGAELPASQLLSGSLAHFADISIGSQPKSGSRLGTSSPQQLFGHLAFVERQRQHAGSQLIEKIDFGQLMGFRTDLLKLVAQPNRAVPAQRGRTYNCIEHSQRRVGSERFGPSDIAHPRHPWLQRLVQLGLYRAQPSTFGAPVIELVSLAGDRTHPVEQGLFLRAHLRGCDVFDGGRREGLARQRNRTLDCRADTRNRTDQDLATDCGDPRRDVTQPPSARTGSTARPIGLGDEARSLVADREAQRVLHLADSDCDGRRPVRACARC